MLRGGYAAQFFGLVSLPVRDDGLARAVNEQIDLVAQAIERSQGQLVAGRTADDVARARAEGRVAALLGIEGAHALEGSIEHLERFARRGVRYLGLAHLSPNAACVPAYGWRRDEVTGLSDFGRDVVDRCQALGVIVDLAHINRRGFFEALERIHGPLLVSHTGIRALRSHWRNIDDDQVRAVGARGGAVGVMFAPRFLGGSGVATVADHIEHVVRIAGEDTPALGSDWDGMIVPSRGLRDPTELPNLLAELGRRFPARVVEKIARDNALRVLREVPPRAKLTGAWA
jgi:membrane dipeptidase